MRPVATSKLWRRLLLVSLAGAASGCSDAPEAVVEISAQAEMDLAPDGVRLEVSQEGRFVSEARFELRGKDLRQVAEKVSLRSNGKTRGPVTVLVQGLSGTQVVARGQAEGTLKNSRPAPTIRVELAPLCPPGGWCNPCEPKTCAAAGAVCGRILDGCFGTVGCGDCPAGQTCGAAGPNRCGTGLCQPKTCSSLGLTCGPADDGCGGELDCGRCTAPQVCGGLSPGSCGCPPENDASFCVRLGAQCGSLSAKDNCGALRTVECGSCTPPQSCGGGGKTGVCGCTPETDQAFCARLGFDCDSATAPDNCGVSRTAMCGTCAAPQSCGGAGKPNQCGCTPACAGKPCGTSDGCTGTCSCQQGQVCSSGTCVCDASSCPSGCCSGSNCVAGTSSSACGRNGAACTACGAGQTCSGQACVCNSSSCPSGCCSGSNCVAGTSNSACGRNGAACAACGAGQTCSSQACVCNSSSCPSGCCSGNSCLAGTSNSACGRNGAACVACVAGQACAGGACVCNSSSCPSGCCSGNSCLAGTSSSACGTNGASCVACMAGQACVGQLCVCNSSSCPSGCCAGTSCLTGTSNSACGTSGAACVACAAGRNCVLGSCQLPGLVAYYRLNEASGTAVADSSGNNHWASNSGATIVAGRVGNALSFDGSDYVHANNHYPALALTNMTLAAWVKPAAGTWRLIVRRGANGALNYRLGLDPNGWVSFNFDNGSAMPNISSATQISNGVWTHLAATYDGTTMRLYINGVENKNQAAAGPPKTSSIQVLSVGHDIDQNDYFVGSLDEVKIFNRALSASEVQAEAQ